MSVAVTLTAKELDFIDRAGVVECDPAAWRRDECELLEALRGVRERLGNPALALISSAAAFTIASIDREGALHGPDGPLATDLGCFEARAFGPDGELRWRRPIGCAPYAVLLCERASGTPVDYRPVELPCCGIAFERRQLLWGRALARAEAAGGWVALAEARIGTFEVPRPEPAPAPREADDQHPGSPDPPAADEVPGDRLQLISHELVAIAADGNSYVADERLVAIEVAQPEGTHA